MVFQCYISVQQKLPLCILLSVWGEAAQHTERCSERSPARQRRGRRCTSLRARRRPAPRFFYHSLKGSLSTKKLIDKKSWGWIPSFLRLEIETLSPEKTISWKDVLQLGKGRRHDPLGGAPPPRTPSRKIVFDFWLKKFMSLGPILA